jgi:hypothetical protein
LRTDNSGSIDRGKPATGLIIDMGLSVLVERGAFAQNAPMLRLTHQAVILKRLAALRLVNLVFPHTTAPSGA